MLSAILLAAGESRRMGDFKQLMTFEGKSFVECCADNILASRVEHLVVVTGCREADVRAALVDRRATFAHNPDYADGMSSSIECGVRVLPPETKAVLIALSDQPQIGAEVHNQLIDAYERERPLIAIPTWEGRGGHPIILDMSLKPDLLKMDPSVGLRAVVEAHRDRTLRLEASTPAVLLDFDYREDYERYGRI
jgi:molybdenum cofactor cytidylyltransferase